MNSDTTYAMQSASAADTSALGVRIGRLLVPPLVLELISDLGGGKTTLVQGLAQGLGWHGRVTSPTFTINHSYELSNGRRLEHFDLYRLGELGVVGPELAEAIADPSAIVAVEWPAQSAGILPVDRLMVHLVPVTETSRQITLVATGPRASAVVTALKDEKGER